MKWNCTLHIHEGGLSYKAIRKLHLNERFLGQARFCSKPLGVGRGLAHFHFHFCVGDIKLQVITSQLSVLTSAKLYLNTMEKKIYNTKYKFSCYGNTKARIKYRFCETHSLMLLTHLNT